MATWDETIPKKASRFLRPEMIGFDRELVLTIDRIDEEEADYGDGKGAQKEYILYWREGIAGVCHPQSIALKGLKTNVTQRKALKEIFGQNQEDCVGRKVRLTIDVGQMPGKTFKTIVLGYAKPEVPANPWLINEVGEWIGDLPSQAAAPSNGSGTFDGSGQYQGAAESPQQAATSAPLNAYGAPATPGAPVGSVDGPLPF